MRSQCVHVTARSSLQNFNSGLSHGFGASLGPCCRPNSRTTAVVLGRESDFNHWALYRQVQGLFSFPLTHKPIPCLYSPRTSREYTFYASRFKTRLSPRGEVFNLVGVLVAPTALKSHGAAFTKLKRDATRTSWCVFRLKISPVANVIANTNVNALANAIANTNG